MINFSQQISDFINYGTYNYKFDTIGNEIINPSSSIFEQVYFRLPLTNYTYNNYKIQSFYNTEFTQFIPILNSSSISSSFPQEAIDQINSITYQNMQLQNQLQTIISNSEVNSGSADVQSIKNIIVMLRIQLGQGNNYNDFDTVYPYLPLSIGLGSQNS